MKKNTNKTCDKLHHLSRKIEAKVVYHMLYFDVLGASGGSAVVGVWYEVIFQITLIRSLRGGISILHGCICFSSFIEKVDYCTHNIDVCCSTIQREQLSIALNVVAIKHGFKHISAQFNTYALDFHYLNSIWAASCPYNLLFLFSFSFGFFKM